jgi:hypothetical protein
VAKRFITFAQVLTTSVYECYQFFSADDRNGGNFEKRIAVILENEY